MTPNPWIEWSKQAPKESDLPIHCCGYNWEHSTLWSVLPTESQLNSCKYDLWRPYVCDIPKQFSGQPDANGWWRIEDNKPNINEPIKFKLKGSGCDKIYMGRLYKDSKIRGEGVILLTDLEAWCPLDMTGPEEKMSKLDEIAEEYAKTQPEWCITTVAFKAGFMKAIEIAKNNSYIDDYRKDSDLYVVPVATLKKIAEDK